MNPQATSRSLAAGSIVALAALVSSCFGPRQDTSRYYVLNSLATTSVTGTDEAISVGVGPVVLPDYLTRSRMAIRISETEIDYSRDDHWAEPLAESVERTLTENLAVLLDTGHVLRYPWNTATPPDIAVAIDIMRFERTASGTVELWATWKVTGPNGVRLAPSDSHISLPAPTGGGGDDGDTNAVVGVQSDALAQLSREIAEAIRSAR